MKPALITRQILADGILDRWKAQCPAGNDELTRRLEALGDSREPDAVDAIIGNNSWTCVPTCDGCGLEKVAVVRVGEEPDYETATAHLCEECLREALALLGEAH